MDASRYRMREAVDEDFPAIAAVRNRQFPDRPMSGEVLRARDVEYLATDAPQRHFVIEEHVAGEVVAFGGIAVVIFAREADCYWVEATVDPVHEHRGLGRMLADAIEEQARAWAARALRTELRGDRPRPLRFARARGFVERRRQWEARQDVATVESGSGAVALAELARQGITLTTLAEEGPGREAVRRAVFAANMAASASIPRVGAWNPPTFEEYARSTLGGVGFLPDAFFLAKEGTRYVGLSVLEGVPDEPETLHQRMTGTIPGYERRGIATALKRRTVEYARSHGYRTIRTTNDAENERMWRINERLGYRRTLETIRAEKTLPIG
jgi:ribosomal protein S18 acetylase RimI-like enzyme